LRGVGTAVVDREEASERRRRIRRSAILYGGIAVAFYLAFIVLTLLRGWR
jgi:hypothetical protein